MATGQAVHDTQVTERRQRAGVVRCDTCGELVVQEAFCSACGHIFSMQGLIDTLIGLGIRKPNTPITAQENA